MSATIDAVRERPILFSGPMVRAILDGPKTQTRRVVTDHTSEGNFKASELRLDDAWVDGKKLKAYLEPTVAERLGHGPDDIIERLYCRWWPDDLLWVRETWCYDGSPHGYLYRADYQEEVWRDVRGWRPSIHMPRDVSRLTLRATDVRAQRVQDISEQDAEAEGLTKRGEWWDVGADWTGDGLDTTARGAFRMRWDSLNAKRGYGWDANPWVWVISFERVSTQPGGAA